MASYKLLLIPILSFLMAWWAGSEELTLNNADKKDAQLWQTLDSLERIRQSQTLFNESDKILQEALSQNKDAIALKALQYKIKARAFRAEDAAQENYEELQQLIQKSDFPLNQLAASYQAELLNNYFQRNSYKLNDKKTVQQDLPGLITDWSTENFRAEIARLHLFALQNKQQLYNLSSAQYELLFLENREANPLSKNVYHVLFQNAKNYFESLDRNEAQNIDNEILLNPQLLSSLQAFINVQASENTSAQQPAYTVLKLYQELLKFHMKKNDDEEIQSYFNIERLKWAHHVSLHALKDSLLFDGLNALSERTEKSSPAYPLIQIRKAQFLMQLSNNSTWPDTAQKKALRKEALEISNALLAKKDSAYWKNEAMRLKNDITEVLFSAEFPEHSFPNKPNLVKVNYKNIGQLHWKIYLRKDLSKDEYLNNKSKALKLLAESEQIDEGQFKLRESRDLFNHEMEFILPSLDAGNYIFVLSDSATLNDSTRVDIRSFNTTNLSVVYRRNSSTSGLEWEILNAKTGVGIDGAEVQLYFAEYDYRSRSRKYTKGPQLSTNKNGHCAWNVGRENRRSIYIDVKYKEELLEKLGSFYALRKQTTASRPEITYFTDRSIYRPGQNVYFKAIALEKDDNTQSLKTDWEQTFRLKDANYQEIEKLTLESDEYGSFSGSFTIPESGLNGNYRISNDFGNTSIRVEAYQRPKFEVDLKPIKSPIKAGDSVEIHASVKTLAGVALQDAQLFYQVEKLPEYFYYSRYAPQNSGIEVFSGEATLDKSGDFSFRFLSDPLYESSFHRYRVKIRAVDITGESQEAERVYRLEKNAFSINTTIPDQIILQSPEKWKINAVNTDGEAVEAKGSIKILKLNTPEQPILNRQSEKAEFTNYSSSAFKEAFPYLEEENESQIENWSVEKQVFERQISGDTELDPAILKELGTGVYKVEIALENKKDSVHKAVYYSLYDHSESKLPYPEPAYFNLSTSKAQVGEKVSLTIGSGYQNAVVEVLLLSKKGEERQYHQIDNALKQIQIPVKEEYQGNFTILARLYRYGRTFSIQKNIQVPFENKKLDLELETSRSVLEPGSKEKWTLNIKDEKGKPVEASVLVSMFDASLDQIYPHQWFFSPFPSFSFVQYDWAQPMGSYRDQLFQSYRNNYKIPYPEIQSPSVPKLETPFSRNFGYRNRYNLEAVSMKGARSETPPTPEMNVVEEDNESAHSDKVALERFAGDVEDAITEEEKKPEKIRSNFAETAFFYDQLMSNKNGEISFVFTLPDAITEWKFQALAYSKELQNNIITEHFEARKKLMIEAQPLRFLRQGDQIDFTAKITNLTDEEISAKAEITLFNPYTNEKLTDALCNGNSSLSVKIDSRETKAVSWRLSIPADFDQPLMYRVKVSAENFSDGEENWLPVLENSISLHKTTAFQIDKGTQWNIDLNQFKALPDGSDIQSVRLEINPNPHWFVIQALPYLTAPTYKNTSALFNRYYAQSIAAHLANQDPAIKLLFKKWGNQLQSPLQRNESQAINDLNNTPWLQEAQKDQARMKNLAQLFNVNQLDYEQKKQLDEILKMQSPNGGWPWIKSMRDSRFITQNLVLGFQRLFEKQIIAAANNDLQNSLNKAISYLDDRMYEDYRDILKLKERNQKENNLSAIQIQYLLIRSAYDQLPVSEKHQEAYAYFINQVVEYWPEFSFMLQAHMARILHRSDQKETSQLVLEALRQNSIENKLGRFWKTQRQPSWYHAQVETQVAIAEAFYEIEGMSPFIHSIQKWLLNEKRTTHWGNGSATADACYAFLLDNQQKWIQENNTQVILNGTKLEADEISKDGSGTVLFTWNSKSELDKLKGKLEILNQQSNLIWGSLSISYDSPLENVKAFGEDLKIEKSLFIQTGASEKENLVSIDNQLPHIGTKLWVRLQITAARNFDFVHLKDNRAAPMEPGNQLSGNRWESGLSYYLQNDDNSTHLFFHQLPKGRYTIDYPVYINSSGIFSSGPAQIQCVYAKAFEGYSDGELVRVKRN